MEEVIAKTQPIAPPVVHSVQENNIIPSVPSIKSVETPVKESLKEIETPGKDSGSFVSVPPSENTIPEFSTAVTAETKPVESRVNEAKKSMSKGVPRHVRNSMIKNSTQEGSVKSQNCNTGCNMF